MIKPDGPVLKDLKKASRSLEELRDEIVKGGVIAEKNADELFATDTIGDEGIVRRQQGQKLL